MIFDDLERCAIHQKELFGYLNYFVEKEKYKVILIADENELKIVDEDYYKRTKEKLIGRTLKVEADIEAAFEYYMGISGLLHTAEFRGVVRDNKAKII